MPSGREELPSASKSFVWAAITFAESFQGRPDQPEVEKQAVPEALQAPRGSHSELLSQNQAQVERRDVQQQPLQDVPMPSQVRPPHSAGVVDVRETSLQQLSPLP